MNIRQAKHPAKLVTISVERLSDHSRITFTISSDKKISHLRSLLNHHLPPCSPNKFGLYSFQRGAFIHYHPPSFRLDYFPVIFDQSVLLLKMDDRNVNTNSTGEDKFYQEMKTSRLSLVKNYFFSRTTMKKSSSTNITCLSIFKQIFHQPSKSMRTSVDYGMNILTY